MSEFHGLRLAVDVARRQRDGMAQRQAQCQRTLEHARSQMQQLQDYADESDASWAQQMVSVQHVDLLHMRHQFMDRLRHAVLAQEQVLAQQQRLLQAAVAQLLKAEFHLAGLQQVLKSRMAQAQLRERRSEQRQSDEMAALRHFHHHANIARNEAHGH